MNMKKAILTLIMCLMTGISAVAQSAGDKIIGTYKAVQEGRESKVKFSKYGDGYRGQIIWLKNNKNADGSIKTDVKNPDKAKRNVPADKIVIIDKVTYEDGIWQNGKIYDPTSGKTYKVELRFSDAKTLEVKGKLGPFFKKVYWTKL